MEREWRNKVMRRRTKRGRKREERREHGEEGRGDRRTKSEEEENMERMEKQGGRKRTLLHALPGKRKNKKTEKSNRARRR